MLSFLKLIGRPIFRILFSVEYHGLENVPESGPVILAGNHPSYLDPVLVMLPVKRVIKYMAWDALFKVPLLGLLIRVLGAFPVDIRKGRGEAAFRQACRVLESGEALGIFPEGQRSEQGPMGELKTGVARLAIETGAPIVPITIGGASRAWPRWKLLPRPAKIVVRYHKPIRLDEASREARRDDRAFHREVMQQLAASINRSLAPALRGAESFERWYRQPPSHLRTYEYVPLAAAIIASVIARSQGGPGARWISVWVAPALYYLYLAADLTAIRQGRLAKWVRNSVPVWLMLAWHYPLTGALGLAAGSYNWALAVIVVAAFFPFFWEDYFTLQKFVRGLVVVYYLSTTMMLAWPHPLGLFTAALGFIAMFSLRHRTIYNKAAALVTTASIITALAAAGSLGAILLAYLALAAATIVYLQTFIGAAYDIRRAASITLRQNGRVAASRRG